MCGSILGGSKDSAPPPPVQKPRQAAPSQDPRRLRDDDAGDNASGSKRSAVLARTNKTGGLGVFEPAKTAGAGLRKTTLG